MKTRIAELTARKEALDASYEALKADAAAVDRKDKAKIEALKARAAQHDTDAAAFNVQSASVSADTLSLNTVSMAYDAECARQVYRRADVERLPPDLRDATRKRIDGEVRLGATAANSPSGGWGAVGCRAAIAPYPTSPRGAEERSAASRAIETVCRSQRRRRAALRRSRVRGGRRPRRRGGGGFGRKAAGRCGLRAWSDLPPPGLRRCAARRPPREGRWSLPLPTARSSPPSAAR